MASHTRRPVSWLVAGRLAGLAGAIGIPMVLARTLAPDEFGAYRQIFLVYATLYAIAQVGMAESLYYFLPRDPDDPQAGGRLAANATGALVVSGVACALVLTFAARPIAGLVGDPALARWFPALGLMVVGMLGSAGLEIVLTCRHRYRAAGTAYFVSDLVRSAFLIVPALFIRRLDAVIAGAVIFALLRLGGTCVVLARAYPRAFRPSRLLFREQLGYALPFAVAIVVDTMQAQLHLYVVSSHFDVATFAIYSIACFQVPVVDFVATSVSNVLMVSLGGKGDAGGKSHLALWRDAVARLAFILLPLAAVLCVLGEDLITFLFSTRYAAAGPLFVLASVAIIFGILPTDAVLRAKAATGVILRIGLVRLATVAVLLPLCMWGFGLAGAILANLAGTAVAKTVALAQVRRRLGTSWRELLPGHALAAGTLASLVAALGSFDLLQLAPSLPRFGRLAIGGTVFALIYLAIYSALAARLGLVSGLAAFFRRNTEEQKPCAASPAS